VSSSVEQRELQNAFAAYSTDRNSSNHFLLSVSNDNLNSRCKATGIMASE